MARILIRDPAELRRTDVPQPVLEALMASKVREVHMIGRRGPAQAKFTTKELRELGELAGVDIVVDPAEAGPGRVRPDRASAQLAESRPAGARQPGRDSGLGGSGHRLGGARRLTVRFWLRPVEIDGTDRVSGLTVERTRLDEHGAFTGTGELETIPRADGAAQRRATRACRCRACRSTSARYTVPNAEGRVLGPDGAPLPGEYVAGLAQARPDRRDRHQQVRRRATVRSLLADLAGGRRAGATARLARRRSRHGFAALLADRGVRAGQLRGLAAGWSRPRRSWVARWAGGHGSSSPSRDAIDGTVPPAVRLTHPVLGLAAAGLRKLVPPVIYGLTAWRCAGASSASCRPRRGCSANLRFVPLCG